jgi:tetratricopeptide (TPR) repeat protein
MKGRLAKVVALGLVLAGCQSTEQTGTISQLRNVEPDLEEAYVDDSLVKAMTGYQRFLQETPGHAMAPEAMRRMADLQIEKEYGVLGDGELIEMPAPESASTDVASVAAPASDATPATSGSGGETDAEFEERTTARQLFLGRDHLRSADLPEGSEPLGVSGPLRAIKTYQKILTDYPWYERNDQVLYQMARAYDELAQPDEAMQVADRLIEEYPESRYVDEVFFRRGEYYFVRKKYLDAEEAYLAVVRRGESSSFYELALYKLGWSLYKQELYEEALHQYIALLDYKLSTGYDFDADYGEEGEGDERRVADTFRVVSLSFSNLGDPDELARYFSSFGSRTFEDRIYRNLAEFHLSKRRFTDAAGTYKAFVELNPVHKVAPHFSMRASEIYEEGGFPLLVVESKREFAKRYGVNAGYWQYFEIDEHPEVVTYLKTNLTDLANHYHALYQVPELEEERGANYGEAQSWYREYLSSFPDDEESPSVNYQLADLLLENQDFGESALEYERTAYDYPSHEQAPAAGYAAIYAHREQLKVVTEAAAPAARLATVESSLKFAETFPDHEHADTVLGAATEDLYDMQDFERAIMAGQWLIDAYPSADSGLRRAAWMIVAHSSFDLERYPEAEGAYSEVLDLTGGEDEDYQSVVDNLAASIYKQGEQARTLEDYATAADHFLRIKTTAPTSEIRPAAEYDAAAALIHLESWLAAAEVLEDFRTGYPDHELRSDATQQLAVVYEKAGELSRSAAEYEQVAMDAEDPELRREAILVAGDLYEQASDEDQALRIYEQYIDEFPAPLNMGLEIRHKVAGIYDQRGHLDAYRQQLEAIVAIDRDAGAERTDRSRFLAAQASLVLTRPVYDYFTELPLVQPFQESLAEKQRRMDDALAAFEALVGYGVGEVTAAATYYMAEIYGHFSDALVASERPAGLGAAELAEYELVIEEEAYPFEERSIEVHQENLELMHTGIFNDWVQQSLDELAVLMPGRYAKFEMSSGYLGSIEFYAYRAPVVPELVPVIEETEVSGVALSADEELVAVELVAGEDAAEVFPAAEVAADVEVTAEAEIAAEAEAAAVESEPAVQVEVEAAAVESEPAASEIAGVEDAILF